MTSGDDGPPPARPQDLLVTILGDYLLPGDAGGLPAYRARPQGARGRADRIFNFGQRTSLDGTWTLLMYTIPKQEGALHHDLRKHLRFLGFTTLQPRRGSPCDRTSDVRRLLDELTAEEHADVFVGLPDRPQRLAHDIREKLGTRPVRSPI